jgi:hypothetical protein
MAWQLIYTSAPQLLQAGRSGFGTVAKHEAIRPSLQTELERISQFSREDGLKKDRVIFSHRVLDLRGERFHVLSRISDAGYDYTGRTNHIAHHIVITTAEAEQCYRTSGCTPTDMILWLSEKKKWHDRWNDPARLLTPEEGIPTGSVTPIVVLVPEGAVTWESVTGSARNAAILAPGGTATEACWPIFPVHCDEEQRLRLIGESLCLHSDPWSVSFSTDTQPTDRIEEIQWRGVSAGSPVERTARQSVRPELYLDTNPERPLPPPVDAFAHQAETGLRKAPPPASSHGRVAATGSIESASRVKAQFTSGSAHVRNSTPTISSVRAKTQPVKPSNQSKKSQSTLLHWLWTLPLWLKVLIVIVIVCVSWGSAEFYLYKVDVKQACLIKDEINKKGNSLIDKQNVSIDFIGKLNVELRGINLFQEPKVIKNLNEINAELNSIQDLIRFDINEKLKNPNTLNKKVYRALAENIPPPKSTQKPTPEPTPPAAKTKTEQTISLKISGNPIASGESINATNGQLLRLEATSSSGSQVSINGTGQGSVIENKTLVISGPGSITLKLSATGNEQMNAADTNVQIIITPPAARITKIEFFDNSKIAWEYFFNNVGTNGKLPGWSYYQTNGLATNLVGLLSAPFTHVALKQFEPYYPISKKESINQIATNAGSCFLRKDDATQEITLTITVDPKVLATNSLEFEPIISGVDKSKDQYTCIISPKIEPLIKLIEGKYAIEYEFNKIKGQSPEEIAAKINATILAYGEKIKNAKSASDQDQEKKLQSNTTNNPTFAKEETWLQKSPDFDNAGIKLSEGLVYKKDSEGKDQKLPPELSSYSAWLKDTKNFNSRKSYREYLSRVFRGVKNSKNTVTCPMEKYFLSDNDIEGDFMQLGKANTEDGRLKLQWNAPSSNTDDAKFMTNLQAYFNDSNRQRIAQILDPPKPSPTPRDYSKELKDAEGTHDKYIKEISNCPSSRILIKDAKNTPLLIFTAQ